MRPQKGLFWFHWLLYFDGVARGYYRGPSAASTRLNSALSGFKCYFRCRYVVKLVVAAGCIIWLFREIAKSDYELRHVRPSVPWLPLDGFLRKLILENFSMICRKDSFDKILTGITSTVHKDKRTLFCNISLKSS